VREFDIEYVRKNLSRLVEEAAQGMPFLILVDGKPRVKVCALTEETPVTSAPAEPM